MWPLPPAGDGHVEAGPGRLALRRPAQEGLRRPAAAPQRQAGDLAAAAAHPQLSEEVHQGGAHGTGMDERLLTEDQNFRLQFISVTLCSLLLTVTLF